MMKCACVRITPSVVVSYSYRITRINKGLSPKLREQEYQVDLKIFKAVKEWTMDRKQ